MPKVLYTKDGYPYYQNEEGLPLGNTPEDIILPPKLPVQNQYKPTTYIIEPDLMEATTKPNVPDDVGFDDAGFPYNKITGQPVQVIRRPNMLPIAPTPDGYTFAMPKMLDVVGNVMGNVGGLAGGKIAAKPGEVVLGSGAVSKMKEAPSLKIKLDTLDNYLNANNIPFKKDTSKVPNSLSSYYYIETPYGVKKIRVSDHIGGVGEDFNFPLGSNAEEAFTKIQDLLGLSYGETELANFKSIYKQNLENQLEKWEKIKVDKKYDTYGKYDYDKQIDRLKKEIDLYSDTRPQVTAAVGRTLEKEQKPFFSTLERTVENAKISKADAQQWLGYLKNQPGVKQEELAYVLKDLPEGQISKEVLSDIIKNNKVELKEVVKGVETPELQKLKEARDYAEKHGTFEEGIAANQAYIKAGGQSNPTKYHDYQLPDGSNYQEMLLTLPKSENGLVAKPEGVKGAWNVYDKSGNKIAENLNPIMSEKEAIAFSTRHSSNQYKSSHWDEPNPVVHVRMNDRIVDGNKTLHLEEIQSDWHQKGREKGYKGESEKLIPEFEKIENKIIKSGDEEIMSQPDLKDALDLAVKRKIITDKEAKTYKRSVDIENYTDQAVPDAPFKKNWDELALKRMLHKAAKEDYDAISWTPGEAQAARYDLSKQVDKINWSKNETGDHIVRIAPTNSASNLNLQLNKEGKVVATFPSSQAAQFEGKHLSDVVGKDIAEKILNKKQGELAGEGLKIGGEGMKAFYDKMLVDKVNAIAKKYGGKVEINKNLNQKLIDAGENLAKFEKQFGSKPIPKNRHDEWMKLREAVAAAKGQPNQPIHYLKLTPELKKKALEGFPLFSHTPILNPVDFNPFEEKKSYRLVPIEGNPFQ